jgi:hypothetical protein
MYNEALKVLLDHILDNAEALTEGKYATVTYVENELFPEGVYRIHMDNLIPRFLAHVPTIRGDLYKIVKEEFPSIEFDTYTGWLTIEG